MPRVLVLALVLLAGAVGGCSVGGDDAPDPPQAGEAASTSRTDAAKPASPAPPDPRPYRPLPSEGYSNAKQLAADVAQRVTTYDAGSTPGTVAGRLPRVAAGRRGELTAAIAPVVDRGRDSRGEIIYPQLSGVTPTSLGAMVVVRQSLYDKNGKVRRVSRVLDIRLQRSQGSWSLDRIGSVGGAPPRAGRPPSAAAKRVLEHPRIVLPDSARWDILRGGVDDALLGTLARAAGRYRLDVTVIDSGHPPNVWATTRPSTHSIGKAVDIYAVDGRPVTAQRQKGSAAFRLASTLVAGGASQVGSPWILGPGGPRSFTDEVHQDHIHLQQTPTG